MDRIVRVLRKSAVAIIGFSVVIIGVALLVLPGPGILVILAGLAILAAEFEWAGRHLERARTIHKKVIEKAKSKKSKDS
jgi:uncharacterized protein (TIGR02611 family)